MIDRICTDALKRAARSKLKLVTGVLGDRGRRRLIHITPRRRRAHSLDGPSPPATRVLLVTAFVFWRVQGTRRCAPTMTLSLGLDRVCLRGRGAGVSVNPTFRSVSSSVVSRIADDEQIAASLLGPLAFDREGVQLAERAAQRPGSNLFQTRMEETRAVTARLASAGVTQAELGSYVLLSQGYRALAHWTECGGPDVIGVVMSTGPALSVDLGYDPIRLQRAEDFAPIVAVLERVELEWNDLVGAGGEPKLRALKDQALAARYIGRLQALYSDAMHRGHAVLAACS